MKSAGITKSNDGKEPAAALARVLAKIESPGAVGEAEYRNELARFAATPDAMSAVVEAYTRLPTEARSARWYTVVVAGDMHSPEAVKFLETVALGPEEVDPRAQGDDAGDQAYRLRYTATVKVVEAAGVGVPGAEESMTTLLKSAEPELARIAGVELYASGKLTNTQRKLLEARGISTNFRKIEGAELDQLRDLSADKGHPDDGKTKAKPAMTSVPEFQAK